MSNIIKVFTILLVLSSTQTLLAQDYKTSAGLRLGTNLAATFKTFVSEKGAIEIIAGITRQGGNSRITAGGFYQIHNQFTNDIPTLMWYFGGGAFVALKNDEVQTNLAIAGIIGLEYTFEDTPLNLFIDGIPYLSFIDGSNFDAEASLGVRYVF